MKTLNYKKFGIATGLTATILYIACILIMTIAGKEGTIKLFNSLLHGLDVTNVARMNVPFLESLIGIVLTFILGWLIGACIGALYNWQIKDKLEA